MAKYFTQALYADDEAPTPPLGPLTGGKIAKATPAVATFRAQDRVVTQSRRIACQFGLKGSTAWLVPDTNPDSASSTHPTAIDYRVACRSKFYVTPGCALKLSVLYSLCGQTQVFIGAGNYDPAGAMGAIRVSGTWTDATGTTEQRSFDVALEPSQLEFGAAPSTGDLGWADLRVAEIGLMVPESMALTTDKNQWTLPAVCELSLSELGGCRIVDAVVSETPYYASYEADDTTDRWCSHMYGEGNPDAPGPSITHPYQRLSEVGADGDRRGGTWHVQDVANNQVLRLGPVLLHWSSFDEDDRTLNSEPPAITNSSATFIGISNTTLTSYRPDKAGFGLSCGGYARSLKLNHPTLIEGTGVVPVIVRAYHNAGGSVGTLRVQSSKSSYVDVALTGAAYGWTNTYGYLEVGKGPGQDNVCQLLWRRDSGGGTMSLRDVVVHYAGQFAQPA